MCYQERLAQLIIESVVFILAIWQNYQNGVNRSHILLFNIIFHCQTVIISAATECFAVDVYGGNEHPSATLSELLYATFTC